MAEVSNAHVAGCSENRAGQEKGYPQATCVLPGHTHTHRQRDDYSPVAWLPRTLGQTQSLGPGCGIRAAGSDYVRRSSILGTTTATTT